MFAMLISSYIIPKVGAINIMGISVGFLALRLLGYAYMKYVIGKEGGSVKLPFLGLTTLSGAP